MLNESLQAAADLVLPVECAGCGRPGDRWCPQCAPHLRGGPIRVRPRVEAGVPVYSGGSFTGPRRRAVIALKEHGRRDAALPLAECLALSILRLRESGELDPPELAPLILVPAPSRLRAALRRGGDPVARTAELAAAMSPRTRGMRLLGMRRGVRDSVGLGIGDRERNLAGRIVLRRGRDAHGLAAPTSARPAVVFVDDVVTTGTTAAEGIRTLRAAGIRVHAVVAVAHA